MGHGYWPVTHADLLTHLYHEPAHPLSAIVSSVVGLKDIGLLWGNTTQPCLEYCYYASASVDCDEDIGCWSCGWRGQVDTEKKFVRSPKFRILGDALPFGTNTKLTGKSASEQGHFSYCAYACADRLFQLLVETVCNIILWLSGRHFLQRVANFGDRSSEDIGRKSLL